MPQESLIKLDKIVRLSYSQQQGGATSFCQLVISPNFKIILQKRSMGGGRGRMDVCLHRLRVVPSIGGPKGRIRSAGSWRHDT